MKRIALLSAAALLGLLFFCSSPTDPTTDPRNAGIELTVTSSSGQSGTTSITDTLGKEIVITVTRKLPLLIDSIRITVAAGADTDTVITLTDKGASTELRIRLQSVGTVTVSALAFVQRGIRREDNCVVMVIRNASRITSQQQDLSPDLGDTVVLFVKLQPGVTALGFAWTKDNAVLPTTADDTLVVAGVSTSSAGTYRCIASYAGGAADTSAPMRITVFGNSVPQLSVSSPGGSLINNRTYASPALPCTLKLAVADPDSGQTRAISVAADRTGWKLDTVSGVFSWTPHAADSGVAIFTFTVADNGTPPLSSSQTIVVMVSSVSQKPSTPSGFHVAEHYSGASTAREVVVLTWRNANFAQEYAVYRAAADSAFLARQGALKDTFLVDTIVSGRVYSYYVVATNAAGSSAPSDTARSTDLPLSRRSLHLVKQPLQSLTAVESTTVRISVVAAGGDSLKYQWYKGSSALLGRTDSVLVFAPVVRADSGIYSCTIRDKRDSSLVSSPCTLSVLKQAQPPVVSGVLADTTVVFGSPLRILAFATGTNLQYRWYLNGTALAGQTSQALNLSFITFADSGYYTIAVWNTLDTVVSDSAHVTVKPLTYAVTIAVTGSGTVTPVGTGGVFAVERNATQRFTFAPLAGQRIKSVVIDGAANAAAATQGYYDFVTVREPHTLAVTFEAIPTTKYTLTVTADPSKGTVTRTPSGDTLASGTRVALKAEPVAGFTFREWTGGLTGSANPDTITMDGSKAVTAVFEADTGAQTITLSPGVSLNAEIKKASAGPASQTIIAPQPGKYDSGTVVVLGKVTVVVVRK